MKPVHTKKPCPDCMFADGGMCEKHMPKMAKGGEMDHEGEDEIMGKEMPADDEMGDTLVDELMDAFERKDKRGIKDAFEALVMECMHKGEM